MRLIILLVAAIVSTWGFAAEDHAAAGTLLRLTARPYIERGMHRDVVREMLGSAPAQLSAEVWVYFDFKAVNAVASAPRDLAEVQQTDAVVIVFKQNRVTLIRACESKPILAFIARRRSFAPTAVAVKSPLGENSTGTPAQAECCPAPTRNRLGAN